MIELFVMMGCAFRELPDQTLDDGTGKRPIRFLYSRETDDFVSLNGYEDDERVPPGEVANWERRLGVVIPKG